MRGRVTTYVLNALLLRVVMSAANHDVPILFAGNRSIGSYKKTRRPGTRICWTPALLSPVMLAPRSVKKHCTLVPKIHGSNNHVWLIWRRESRGN
ncbi:MAG: hypothetical protein JWN73_328 [Betaproteobacteria bacterium]|nr:hypothetical protein [Betaproteobacteria bacterium]